MEIAELVVCGCTGRHRWFVTATDGAFQGYFKHVRNAACALHSAQDSATPSRTLRLARMEADLHKLLAEIGNLANSMDSSGLRETDLETDLEYLKLPEGAQIKLRLRKRDEVMEKVKKFLDSYDSFFGALTSTNFIAASLYGGVKCIVTVSLDSTLHVDAESQPY